MLGRCSCSGRKKKREADSPVPGSVDLMCFHETQRHKADPLDDRSVRLQGTLSPAGHWEGLRFSSPARCVQRTVMVPLGGRLIVKAHLGVTVRSPSGRGGGSERPLLVTSRRRSRIHALTRWKMTICAKKMDYPPGSQCQRVQSQVVKVGSEKERASLLCMKALAGRVRLDSVSQHMSFHPQYLESFLRAQHYVLHMDGPLPLPYRHYIAIMAAARYRCRHLVSLHSAHFLRVGGDPLWLQGLESVPLRLRHLDHINKVLAHRPWLTAPSHIQELLKMGEQCWSLAELVQAVVLLAHCHSLCSFVFGSGVEGGDHLAGSRVSHGTPPSHCYCDAANGNGTVHAPPTVASDRTLRRRSLDSSCEAMCLRERLLKVQEEKERIEEQRLGSRAKSCKDEEEEEVTCDADPSRFVTDPEFSYQEFARREEDHFEVFRVQDYSWEDHGFSLVNRLYSDIGHLLDERFRMVASLPSPRGPDLKRAIWNYIHCILGIRYDDYDYGEVNQLLERELKLYIKTVACYPDPTKSPPCTLHWARLKPGDKVHINLLIMEARLQAELLYALRAITQYMIS
ncbi:sestrin-3-like [Arapaima gigas]